MNSKITPPFLFFCAFVLLWHYSVIFFDIPPFIVPSPKQTCLAAYNNAANLFAATWFTAQASLLGFAISMALGMLIALMFTVSKIARYGLYPYAIFLQTVPIVAIAPLIVVWFGNGFQSIVIIVVMISLFPIITNATTGLIATKQDLVDLFLVNNANAKQILFKLRLPHSIPFVITGAKISSGLCVIGAIVGEFFAGSATDNYGLGYLITLCAGNMQIGYLFASVFMCTVLGLLFFGSISVMGSYILKNRER